MLFFAVFFFMYNIAMSLTSAARGSLALSVLPLTTMLAAALLGREELTRRKTCGVLIAIAGVAVALSAGLADAPTGAWRGDLIMALATICMALYNVWSRPLMARSSMLGFLAAGMGCGAAASVSLAWASGGPRGDARVRARRSGSRCSAWASSAARPRSTSGCTRSSAPRRRASPTR